MKQILGGSIFAHNAVKYDYCLREAIASLCYTCDHVVALTPVECEDGTFELMQEIAPQYSNLQIIKQGNWECNPDKHRLSTLANLAKDLLPSECNWHFMLQADEVLHESAKDQIRKAISLNAGKGYRCRRINLWGDFDHYINFQSRFRPCGDAVCRLAIRSSKAVGDAESLDAYSHDASCMSFVDKIVLFHYGFVRNPIVMCDKIIDMQSWFFGPGGQPDQRVVKNKKEHGSFQPFDSIPRSECVPISISHPVFMRKWLEERRPFWPHKI